MSRRPPYVIVGASLTGGAAATALRQGGFEGRIVMIGAEPHLPYERPPLSKEYLRGEATAERALLHPESWYSDNGIETMLSTRAIRIDEEGKVVHLEGGDGVPYDRVLVASGGRNRKLSVPGGELGGIHDLRTIEDADRLRAEAVRGRRAVVVGAGFIGCEVAASLRNLGVDVEVVEIFEVPLYRALGLEIGRIFEGIHRDNGIRFHFGETVERFEGKGRVEGVVTDKGTRIGCDFAVVGVGIQPNTEVAEGSGVELDNGIVVDELCRTNVEGIFAAGDVANHFHPLWGRRMRVEHWDNALKQGGAAARNMLGQDTIFDDPHWFWSDQYEYNLQFMGFAPEWDELVIRGSLEERDFAGFYLHDGVVRAAVALNRGKDVRRSAGMIRARARVDPAALRDEDVDLRKLAEGAR
jgi:3-phenylpropionate/trans-cinnamate dioxygenase ferredoxin reductase subunit